MTEQPGSRGQLGEGRESARGHYAERGGWRFGLRTRLTGSSIYLLVGLQPPALARAAGRSTDAFMDGGGMTTRARFVDVHVEDVVTRCCRYHPRLAEEVDGHEASSGRL